MPRWVFLTVALFAATGAWAAFERPSENERLAALGNRFEEPEPLRTLLRPDGDFPPITPPGPDGWLAVHPERGQSFEEYRAGRTAKTDDGRRIIYLLPLGEFPEESSPPLDDLRAYAAAFFQLEVKVLPAYHPHELEFDPRKSRHGGQRQIWTKSVMDFLKTRLPADACCLLGVTMTDIYPDPSWNFVFGQASLEERVGVYSFARYDPAFWSLTRRQDYRDLILQRSCKVLVHETAHLFGLPHCIYYDCVVNGSNDMDETDAQPQHLCPVCLRKLHLATGLDAVKRYAELAKFYHDRKWFEDYDWVQRQLAKIPEPALAH